MTMGTKSKFAFIDRVLIDRFPDSIHYMLAILQALIKGNFQPRGLSAPLVQRLSRLEPLPTSRVEAEFVRKFNALHG